MPVNNTQHLNKKTTGSITLNYLRRHYNITARTAHRIKEEEEEAMMLVNSAETVNTNPATYKLFMADTSQVYCGRSLPNHKKKNDVADDNKIGLASILASSYRPARTRRPNIVPRDDGDDLAKTDLHRRSSTDSDSSMSTSDGSSGSGSDSRRRSSTTSADGGGGMMRRNSTGGGGGGPTLRRKCQPLHRQHSNQSVSSIMRPSRYSMTSSTHSLSSELNDSSLHSSSNQAATSTATAPKPRRISRRATLDGLPAQSMHSYFQKETYKRSNSLDHQWVASGVDFSSSVEVYVFRK